MALPTKYGEPDMFDPVEIVEGLFVDSRTDSVRIAGGCGIASRGLEVASATGYTPAGTLCTTVETVDRGDTCCDPSRCCCVDEAWRFCTAMDLSAATHTSKRAFALTAIRRRSVCET